MENQPFLLMTVTFLFASCTQLERGDYHQHSRNTYLNTDCKMKLDGKMSRSIQEHSGTRQGHVKASGHFKAYINPCLDALEPAECQGYSQPLVNMSAAICILTFICKNFCTYICLQKFVYLHLYAVTCIHTIVCRNVFTHIFLQQLLYINLPAAS